MTFCFRPSPLLQETRSLTVSSDNGLVTPLPMPFSDLWDINSVPGAGLTLEYTISNISQYQGRIIYINKTQDTTGSTIELTLPGGYVFSSSGTSTLLFPDEPATLALVFSASPIVSVMSGVGGGGISVSPRQSSARINVDPTSNQDPTTNGLLLPAGTTEFTMPITIVDQGLGIANPYVDDPNGDYTIGSDNLEINNALDCRVSIMIEAVGKVAKTAPLVAQVLLQGETIFTSPPLCSAATMAGLDVGPFGPYTKAWFLSGTANAKLSVGDTLIVRILPNNPTDDNAITLTSNISICRIDDQGIVGPQGPPGPTPDAFENGVFQAALNPGINFTNLDCSPSAFGASVTQTINAVPINYQVTDINISGSNCINQINNGNNLALVSCSSGPPAIQISVPTGVCQINSASLELTSLPPIVTPKPNILYYDPTSKVVNYAKCPSQRIASSLNTVVISNATAINTPFRTLTIPANTVASAGDILEFVCTFDGGNCPQFAAQLVGAGFPGTKISTDCAVVRKDKLTFTTVAGIIASFNWTTEYYTTVGAKMTAEYNGTNNINQTIANSMQYSIHAANVGITSFYSAVCTLYRA